MAKNPFLFSFSIHKTDVMSDYYNILHYYANAAVYHGPWKQNKTCKKRKKCLN